MAVLAHAGTFASKTSGGSQSINGVGFTPTAIVFFASGSANSSINTATSNSTLGMGFVTAVGEQVSFCAGGLSASASGSGLSRGEQDSCVLWAIAGTGIAIEAALTSFDADGFTLNYVTANATARSVSYLALAGVTAQAGVIQVPTVGASIAKTGVGFQPKLVLLVHHGMFATGANRTGFFFGYGAASATTERAAMSTAEASGTPAANNARIQLSDCVVINTDPDGATDMKCDLASFDADGFTLSISTNPTSAADVGYLAISGVSAKVGTDTQATSITTKTTSGLPHTPVGLFLSTVCATSSASSATGMSNTVGTSDGANDASQWSRSTDNADPTAETKTHSNANAIQIGDSTATTILAQADVSSFASGQFTLNWSTADATAREFFYASLGEPAATPALAPWLTTL